MISTDRTHSCLAIVGAGSLGQAYAALLAHAGHRVTLVATPGTASDLLEIGSISLTDASSVDVPVTADPRPAQGAVAIATDLSGIGEAVGILFTTKAHQLSSAIASAAAPAGAVSWVAGVQNGILKDDLLADAFGPEIVVGAATILGAQRVRNGEVRVTALGTTYFGELAGGASERVETIVADFVRGGVPAQAVSEISSLLWTKACNATGAFGVSVLTGPEAPLIGYNRDLMSGFLALARETAMVAEASGHPVRDFDGLPPVRSYVDRPLTELLDELPEPPPQGSPRTYPSMLQDHLAGRPMEVEEVFADIVARGERLGVAVPRLTFVRDLLRGLQCQPSAGSGATPTVSDRVE